MKWAALAVAVVGVLAVLWLAGEQHRENCVSAERTSCSVLPWDSGQASGSTWRDGGDSGGWRDEANSGGWRDEE